MKYFILILFLVGCVTKTEPVSAPAPILKTNWHNSKFEAYAAKAVDDLGGPLMIPSPQPVDMGKWCELPTCDRKKVYVEILAELALYESAFDPNAKYTEKFPDSAGKSQISAGLLSLSVDDGKNYGCEFKVLADVMDPEQNLRCGVRILVKLIGKDGVISGGTAAHWESGAKYWSQFRKPEVLAAMRSAVKAVFE